MKKVSSPLCVFSLLFVGVCQAKMRTEHKPYPYRLVTEWYENGQKMSETNYKDGKEVE